MGEHGAGDCCTGLGLALDIAGQGSRAHFDRRFVHGLFVLGVMAACTAARWDSGNGLAFHTLLVVQLALAWMVWLIARRDVVSSLVAHSAENQPAIATVEASPGDSSTVDATTLERLAQPAGKDAGSSG